MAQEKKETAPFFLKDGIEVWEDTLKIPFDKITIIEQKKWGQGKTSGELEKKAVKHAQRIGAQGLYVYKREKIGVVVEQDVGRKEEDMNVSGFDLKEHGVVQEKLHYGQRIRTVHPMFEIKVRFFKYKDR